MRQFSCTLCSLSSFLHRACFDSFSRFFLHFLLAVFAISLCSKLRIDLFGIPYTPYPYVVTLIGFLCSRSVIISAFPFALLHVVINPFFPTSSNGITIGYFAGFLLSAIFINRFKNRINSYIILTFAPLITLFFGVTYIAFAFASIKYALMVGLLPFVLTDIMQSFFAFYTIKAFNRLKRN